MSDPISSSLQANFKVFRDLKEGERVGMLMGHLYSYNPSTLFSKIVNFFLSVFSDMVYTQFEIEELALEYATLSLKDHSITEASKSEFLNKIQNLVAHQVLNPEIYECQLKFEKSVQELIAKGDDPLVAEAKVSIEMAFDNKVPENYRNIIMPEETSTEGMSGSYFILNRFGKKIGVFKPQDEEPYQKNCRYEYRRANPNVRRLRKGHPPGTGYKNEALAYKFDKGHFAGVPLTEVIKVQFPQKMVMETEIIEKEGSFQAFVKGSSILHLEDETIRSIPAQEVHKIGLFDILTGNSDRNLGNFIYDEQEQKLHPIDHGLCFLDSMDWMNEDVPIRYRVSDSILGCMVFPQSKVPFNEECKKYVREYDIIAAVKIMEKEGFTHSQTREFTMRAIFLKECVERDFTLYEIGKMSSQTTNIANVNEHKTTFMDECRNLALQSLVEENKPVNDDTFFPRFQEVVEHRLERVQREKINAR